jgi:hypothetical protein
VWKSNGLSIVLVILFLGTLFGHSVSGWKQHNAEEREHGGPSLSYGDYLQTADFGESVFENWESEFFQMAMYVFLTVFLFQKGSSESKDPEKKNEVDDDPALHRNDKGAPAPVRKGGWQLTLYKNSLGLAFAFLFLLSFLLHGFSGARSYSEKQREHGSSEQVTTIGYLGTSQFWYESFQNWQSEFLAVLSIVTLSIWLRQWGSPESKPVHAQHSDTGSG